jgi:hypothetical protein
MKSPASSPFGRRQRDEIEKGVQTEHDEDEAEQGPGDDSGDFHFLIPFCFLILPKLDSELL